MSISRLLSWSLAFAIAGSGVSAHPANLTGATLKVQRDGRIELQIQFEALAFLINDLPERIPDSAFQQVLTGSKADLEAMIADGRERMRRQLSIRDHGKPLPLTLVAFPSADEILAPRPNAAQSPLLLTATVQGTLESGGHSVTIHFPEVIGTVVVTVEQPRQEAEIDAVAGGDTSRAFQISILGRGPPQGRPFLDSFRNFVVLGFRHILPEGLDHILFVLGLFLLNVRVRSLLAQVTAFTLAHSLTLGLSLSGVVRLPSAVVEPLIALSIVLIAWDNLRASEVRPGRLLLVFGFGLIHGLGFAGALRDLHLERSQFATALVGFNIGIELGQLTVIAIAFALVGWARGRIGYRQWVVVPASMGIGLVAIVWTIQRIL